eukprot:TRINITY_DN8279_c0_g1_i1.p1 TRINITY_DN8279_c0_g1~~TRINITY_DN8279_c0_g1_i1.p1  ORF type:complete len:185 (-),score=5.79 TRINITY_DN8279_c0_g1_i1:17-571(-)
MGGIEHYKLEGQQHILPVLRRFTHSERTSRLRIVGAVISKRETYTIPISYGAGAAQIRTSVNMCIEHNHISVTSCYGKIVTVMATDSQVLAFALEQLGLAKQAAVALEKEASVELPRHLFVHRHPTPSGWYHAGFENPRQQGKRIHAQLPRYASECAETLSSCGDRDDCTVVLPSSCESACCLF